MYRELELRNWLFQEDHARDCQEIEELRRICVEADQARQARIEKLSLQHQRNLTAVSQMTAQVRVLQKVNSLSDAREFHDPESGSRATHVPDQTSKILSSKTLPRCDSGLPRNTQNGTGTMGNVLELPSVQEGQPATVHNSKNLASCSQELEPDITETARKERERKRESLNAPFQSPHFTCAGIVTASKEFTSSWALHNAACQNVKATSAKIEWSFLGCQQPTGDPRSRVCGSEKSEAKNLSV